MFRKIALTATTALALTAGSVLAAGKAGEITDVDFAHEGPFGTFDTQQLQRGCANLARLHGLTGLYPTVFQEETRHVSNQ